MEIIEVTTTVAQREQAERIGHHLVEQRLAGCVQITGPITSIYRWQGKVAQDTEWRLTVKTSSKMTQQVFAAIVEHHPYDEPELLATMVVASSPSYATWLQQQINFDER